MGWWASDTAHLRFDDCRVPVANLIGSEGTGFLAVMLNFNAERFALAAGAVGFAWACYQEALAWARQRQTFGKRSRTTRWCATGWWTCWPASRRRAPCSRKPRGGSTTVRRVTPRSSPRSAC